ncbi:MAG: hypothetical protein FJ035_06010 [Chloroflexi bacterium]|nr:hypothetical protein [Chloroflexota bacterium]
MVGLPLRGARLWARLDAAGVPVLEVFPGMTQDRLRLPRKQADLAGLERGCDGWACAGCRARGASRTTSWTP